MPDQNIPDNPIGTWDEYFDATVDQPVHFLFQEALRWLPEKGQALDLGCGVGAGSLFLASQGLSVTSVDGLSRPLEILASRAKSVERGSVEIVQSKIEDFPLTPHSYDVVAATFSLFFVEPDRFLETWSRIVASLKPNGLFLGQLLGPGDDWAKRGYPTQSEEEISSLFSPFDILVHHHVVKDGATVQRQPKHWDIHHIVARKTCQ
jgi:tellurite methyltransferase